VIVPPVDPNLEPHLGDKPPLRDDASFAAGKIAIFQYGAVIIFLFLISGFWTLQVRNNQVYDERAQHNSIKSIPIPSPRGRILDRDGRVIVDNHSSFTLILARESLKEEHLRPIAQGLDLEYTELSARVLRMRNQPKYVPIVVKDELSPADLAFVESHRDFFPELVLIQAQRRLYPQNGMLAHVIGYTGEVSEAELDEPEFAKYDPGDVVGKFGIEKEYNDWLTGVDGERQVVVDNRGQVKQVLATKPSEAGKDLKLSIDLDLQVVAELAMDAPLNELHVEHKSGAVVALDPRTGEVLAMVSRPTFDPNKFAVRIKTKDWKEIAENPDHPLLNKAIQAQQPPGSTFKPFTALAALESGAIDEKFSVHCSGGVALYGKYQRCWEPRGHGTVALHTGMAKSCDVYFYTIGAKAGIDNLSYYGDLAGFGHPTGIDLPHEKEGLMPSEKWKLRTQRQKWYAGETPSVAIGQGALIVTPLQLARATGGLSIGGVWHTPHLRKDMEKPDKPVSWTLNQENVKAIISGMYGVVNEGGTGGRAKLPGIAVCGKTGTAQLTSEEYAKAKGKGANLENAWFEGFAPCEAPEIVVVTMFEHFPGHGQYAAPVVRDIMKAYFDKKARLSALEQQKREIQAKMSEATGLGVGGSGLGNSAPAPSAAASAAGDPAAGQRLQRQESTTPPQPPTPNTRPQN
jgi:penicillin-binding protein 2